MYPGLPSAILSLSLSNSNPMPIKSGMQKDEVKCPKQSREHDVHNRRFMPHSYANGNPCTNNALRESRTSSLEK